MIDSTTLNLSAAIVVIINRFRIIIKCKNGKRFRELINKSVDEFFESKYAKQTSISLDVNPE